jgi:hypothetical protein
MDKIMQTTLPVFEIDTCMQVLSTGSYCGGKLESMDTPGEVYRQPLPNQKKPIPLSKCTKCNATYGYTDLIDLNIKHKLKSIDPNGKISKSLGIDIQTYGETYIRFAPPTINSLDKSDLQTVLVSIAAKTFQIHFWNHVLSCFKVRHLH